MNQEEVNSEGHSLRDGDVIKISDLRFRWKKNDASESEELSVISIRDSSNILYYTRYFNFCNNFSKLDRKMPRSYHSVTTMLQNRHSNGIDVQRQDDCSMM